MGLRDRLVHAYNAFMKDERLGPGRVDSEPSYYGERGRGRGYARTVSERTTVGAIYTRIAIDAASVPVRHVRVDEEDRFLSYIRSRLDECLRIDANRDQTGRAMRQDAYHTMCEEGVIALLLEDATLDPEGSASFDVGSIRVGVITEWKPSRVKIRAWNGKEGEYQEVWQSKKYTPIIQNPLKAIMNEPNSTLQRLMAKLALMDTSDELVASGKLDLIIQLPYAIKSETRRDGAERRRKDIEVQLKGSKYGVAYTDATEKITQLNRPAENNLLAQVEWLTQKAYAELGITKEIMDGTADEAAMINYYNRTIEPFVAAFVDEVKRKWLTRTARTQGQDIMSFRDVFKLMPISQIAEVADKFTRNEILTSNEVRQAIGYKPSKDPKADLLTNSNMPTSDTGVAVPGDDPDAEVDALSDDFEAELDTMMHDEMAGGFIANFLSHRYDPQKAHEYYLRTRVLKGRRPPRKGDLPTRRAEVTDIGDKAKSQVGSQRSAAIQRLVDKAKEELTKLTEEFRSWVESNPKVSDEVRYAKRREMLDRKDVLVRKLKSDVAQITSAASKKSIRDGGTEGRHR